MPEVICRTLSTYYGNAVLDALVNNVALQVTAAHVSLHSASPGLTGADELADANNYARLAMAFDDPTATPGETANTAAITMQATGGAWVAATHAGLWDNVTHGAGEFIIGGSLTDARTILQDEQARWSIGACEVKLEQTNVRFSTWAQNGIINALLRNTQLQVASLYLSLHSADPGATGLNELAAANGYGVRPAVSFGTVAAKSVASDAAVETPEASADWVQATHLGLWDAAGAGNFVWGQALTAARTIRAGKRFRAEIGDIVVNIT